MRWIVVATDISYQHSLTFPRPDQLNTKCRMQYELTDGLFHVYWFDKNDQLSQEIFFLTDRCDHNRPKRFL